MLNRTSLLMSPLVIIGLATCFFAQRHTARQKVNWQAWQTVNVQLAVRDKDGLLGQYDALFIVTGPKGKEWKASKHADGSEAGVFFPEDFYEVGPPTGKYTWRCTVKDEVIIEGQFEYAKDNSKSDAIADILKIKFN
jgi:hypothetical protein